MTEIVADGTEFGSEEWYEARWNSLTPEQQQKAIAVCQKIVSPKDFENIRRKQIEYGHQWVRHLIDLSDEDQKDFQEMGLVSNKRTMSAHHIWGANIRNQLRHGVCPDEDLPPAPYPDGEGYSNWDDYYCQALEAAAKLEIKLTKRYKFTDSQEEAIGQVVVDNWGANLQTGFDSDGVPYIYAQLGPQLPMRHYSISADGTVMVGGSSVEN